MQYAGGALGPRPRTSEGGPGLVLAFVPTPLEVDSGLTFTAGTEGSPAMLGASKAQGPFCRLPGRPQGTFPFRLGRLPLAEQEPVKQAKV